MNLNISLNLIIGNIIFSIFGWFIFKAGRKDSNIKKLVLGLVLMLYGYIVYDPLAFWAIGSILLAANFWLPWINS